MSQLIQRTEESSHWYLVNGTAYHTVPNKSRPGESRSVTLRDARTAGALPSVTNILNVISSPQLEAWKREQVVLSALTLPRNPGEDDQSFARRVVQDAETISRDAMDLGTRVHACAEAWVREQPLPDDLDAWAHFAPARSILGQFSFTHVEAVVVNAAHGYGGRLDAAGHHKESLRRVVADIKTQNVKVNAKGEPAPSYYDKWALQLAAYAMALGLPQTTMLCSVVISTSQPGAWLKVWDDKPLSYYWEAFQAAALLWRFQKGYDPRQVGGAS